MALRIDPYKDLLAEEEQPRRGVNWAVDTPAPNDVRSDAQAEWDAARTRYTGRLPALRGLARQLTGDAEGAREQYRRVDDIEQRAAALDSDVSTDLRDAGSVGEGLAILRKLAIGSTPDMLTMGAGGLAGRQVARRAALGGETRALARNPSQELSQAAATARPGAAAADAGVAAAQRQEALQKAARRAVRGDTAAKTP